jgi:hypothetical protein
LGELERSNAESPLAFEPIHDASKIFRNILKRKGDTNDTLAVFSHRRERVFRWQEAGFGPILVENGGCNGSIAKLEQ